MDTIPLHPISTPDGSGKLYVRLTRGRFQNLRRLISWPLIALFFGLVWLQWNGQPLLLFSFAERHILAFGYQFSWRDLPLLAGLLISGATLLFFASVAWGRVWCGFACPQSIWTWLFIRIEDLTEGRAHQRRKQDAVATTLPRILRRTVKHSLWLLLALLTAITFSGYFVPVREIMQGLLHAEISTALLIWLLVMTALTYLNAGLVREKICLHACPYSRFQSVMFDADTRTVSYDTARGEPRSHLRQQEAATAQGDCVDCQLCVQVCPAGIDIRHGLQAACIDCAACIDACDGVMRQIQRPTGLIRFASEHQLQGQPSPLWRPRLLAYGLVVVVSASVVAWGFSQRNVLQADVQRNRQQLYVQGPDNRWCNDYQLKLERFDPALSEAQISLNSPSGRAFELFGPDRLELAEVHAHWQNYRVCGEAAAQRTTAIEFRIRSGEYDIIRPSTFLTGAP